MIELLHIDCMEYMKTVPDKYFELAIVDPPYGININNNMGRRKGDKNSTYKVVKWDNETPREDYFIELVRISKNQIMWGANYFITKIPNADSSCWLMWDKMFSEEVSFSQYEMAWTSFCGTSKKFTYHPSNQKDRIHPTQKPIKLYKWLLTNYAKEGDKILDTHLGSGSSAIAAHSLGFDFVGCELDEDYYKAALKRYNDFKLQQTMF